MNGYLTLSLGGGRERETRGRVGRGSEWYNKEKNKAEPLQPKNIKGNLAVYKR